MWGSLQPVHPTLFSLSLSRIKKAVRGRTTQAQVRFPLTITFMLPVVWHISGISSVAPLTIPPLQSSAGLFSGVKLTMNQPNGTTQPQSSTASAPGVTMAAQGPNSTLNSTYLQQLRSLNVSVSEWIGQHVTDNPYVDLTPIFKDYESHLRSIDEKYKAQSSMQPPAAVFQKDVIVASQGDATASSQEEDTATGDSKATSSDSDSAAGESVNGECVLLVEESTTGECVLRVEESVNGECVLWVEEGVNGECVLVVEESTTGECVLRVEESVNGECVLRVEESVNGECVLRVEESVNGECVFNKIPMVSVR